MVFHDIEFHRIHTFLITQIVCYFGSINKQNQIMKKITIIFSILLFMMYSCKNPVEPYKNARQKNTIEAYQSFISDFAGTEYADSATQQIRQLKFEKASNANSIESYESFIAEFQESSQTDTAKERILQLSYDNALKINTVESYRDFMTKFADNPYKDEINRKIKKIEYATSDAGIKDAVLKKIDQNNNSELKICIKRAEKNVIVSNGNVILKMNCVRITGCYTNNRMEYFGYLEKCQQWLRSMRGKIQTIQGVKSVTVVDLGS